MKEYKVLRVYKYKLSGLNMAIEWKVYDYSQKNFPIGNGRDDPGGCALIEYVLNFYGKQGWRLVSSNTFEDEQYLYLERDI